MTPTIILLKLPSYQNTEWVLIFLLLKQNSLQLFAQPTYPKQSPLHHHLLYSQSKATFRQLQMAFITLMRPHQQR